MIIFTVGVERSAGSKFPDLIIGKFSGFRKVFAHVAPIFCKQGGEERKKEEERERVRGVGWENREGEGEAIRRIRVLVIDFCPKFFLLCILVLNKNSL